MPALISVVLVAHLIRWPVSSIVVWCDGRAYESFSVAMLVTYPAHAVSPPTWASPAFFLAPVILLHGIWLAQRSAAPAISLLFVWGAYFGWLLFAFVRGEVEIWRNILLDPFAKGASQFGLVTLFWGTWAVAFGALGVGLAEARSVRDAIAILLLGGVQRRDPMACRKCGYSLIGLTSERCPECGTPGQAAARELTNGSVTLSAVVMSDRMRWSAKEGGLGPGFTEEWSCRLGAHVRRRGSGLSRRCGRRSIR